jgi:hypothetical protein
MQDTDLTTDDEALRETALTSGPQKCARWEIRPTAALEISWMQRNKILTPDMDVLWRAAGFAFLHSAPKATVRAVVNEFARFASAVDDWMDKNAPTAQEIADLQRLAVERTNQYFASFSETAAAAGTAAGN